MLNRNVALQHMIMKKMMTNLNVLCLRVLNWVMSNLDGTLIVTEERHILHVDAIVLESLLHPQQLSIARNRTAYHYLLLNLSTLPLVLAVPNFYG